jgi:hypothetical protein
MSCCGQKRSALKQGSPAAPAKTPRARSTPRSWRQGSSPGQRNQLNPSAAMLAYLARNATRLRLR